MPEYAYHSNRFVSASADQGYPNRRSISAQQSARAPVHIAFPLTISSAPTTLARLAQNRENRLLHLRFTNSAGQGAQTLIATMFANDQFPLDLLEERGPGVEIELGN